MNKSARELFSKFQNSYQIPRRARLPLITTTLFGPSAFKIPSLTPLVILAKFNNLVQLINPSGSLLATSWPLTVTEKANVSSLSHNVELNPLTTTISELFEGSTKDSLDCEWTNVEDDAFSGLEVNDSWGCTAVFIDKAWLEVGSSLTSVSTGVIILEGRELKVKAPEFVEAKSNEER